MKKENIKFETLHRGFNFKKIFIGLVVIVAIGSVVILKGSKANYTYQEIIPFAEGVVRIRKADLNLMAVNIQTKKDCTNKDTCYETKTDIPSSGYKLNTTNSYCTVDNGTEDEEDKTIPMEYKDGRVYIGVNKKGTRCYIYLDIKETAKEKILADNKNIQPMPSSITGPACASGTNSKTHDNGTCTMSDSGIYTTTDEKGTSYVYRGTVDNNWVKFGKDSNSKDMWWRIIRINGDGSVRMIYAGTGSNAPQTGDGKWATAATSTSDSVTQIEISTGKKTNTFNDSYDDNAYVGYMYGTKSSSTWSATHSNDTPSSIKKVLDDWYNKNLTDEATYLSDSAGFCGDRSSSTDTSTEPAQAGGTGKTVTYYGAHYRNVKNKKPSLTCKYPSNDLYTVVGNQENKGNKKLQYPIGLITADEVAFAGGLNGYSNYGYWLWTGSLYWTMSPSYFYSDGYARVFHVDDGGWLAYTSTVKYTRGVRPVINLKADVTFEEGGTGKYNNPYVPT